MMAKLMMVNPPMMAKPKQSTPIRWWKPIPRLTFSTLQKKIEKGYGWCFLRTFQVLNGSIFCGGRGNPLQTSAVFSLGGAASRALRGWDLKAATPHSEFFTDHCCNWWISSNFLDKPWRNQQTWMKMMGDIKESWEQNYQQWLTPGVCMVPHHHPHRARGDFGMAVFALWTWMTILMVIPCQLILDLGSRNPQEKTCSLHRFPK